MKHTGNVALIISLVLLTIVISEKYKSNSIKKIGVVQRDKLVYEFKGMKEATVKYTEKLKTWENQSDSLKTRLQQLYDQIRIDSLSNNKAKLETDVKTFLIFRKSYNDHLNANEENAQKEDKQMTLGVINQINEYIKDFSKKEGYDIILCNSEQQPLGFIDSQIEITEDVLEFANKKYEGEK